MVARRTGAPAPASTSCGKHKRREKGKRRNAPPPPSSWSHISAYAHDDLPSPLPSRARPGYASAFFSVLYRLCACVYVSCSAWSTPSAVLLCLILLAVPASLPALLCCLIPPAAALSLLVRGRGPRRGFFWVFFFLFVFLSHRPFLACPWRHERVWGGFLAVVGVATASVVDRLSRTVRRPWAPVWAYSRVCGAPWGYDLALMSIILFIYFIYRFL
jgi:hypothetical protein